MWSRVGGSEAEMSRSESHFTRLTVCVSLQPASSRWWSLIHFTLRQATDMWTDGEVKVWPPVRGYCSFENKNGGSSLGELSNFSIISFIRTGEYFFVSRLALACDRQQSSNHLSSTYLKMSASFQENIQHPSFQTPSSMDIRVKTLERTRLGSWRNTASSWLA